MTQGSKIGLLVSLVFLIALLVLLSDHVATTSDARPAQVTQAGSQVAQAITTPGPRPLPARELVANSAQIAPDQPVPIVQEMVARSAPPRVDIGPGATGEVEIRAANNNVPVNVRVGALADTPVLADSPVKVGPGASVMSLADAARQVDPAVASNFLPVEAVKPAPVTQVAALTPGPVASPKSFEHTARPGDTVSKMVRKYYGLDTKSNRDLIIAANKTLKSNPNKIEVGQSYTIPVKPGSISAAQAAAAPIAASVVSPVVAPTAQLAPVAPAPVAAAEPVKPAERIYIVKPGDNLWKIAKEQCKDINKLNQIKKLNADALKSGVDLKVGTKLRLPAE